MRSALPNCALCGRFISWKKGYASYIPFGSALDTEPPDEEFIHLSCYNALDKTRQSYYTKYVWSPLIKTPPEDE